MFEKQKLKMKRRTDVPDLAELKTGMYEKQFLGPSNTKCSRWGHCMLHSLCCVLKYSK